MVKVNFSTAGSGVPDEGLYRVTLEKATDKKTRDGNKDMVLLTALVSEVLDGDNNENMVGRRLFRNFVFDPSPDGDNSASTYYLQKALLAFDADEESVTEDGVDPVKDIVMHEDGIKGNTAIARVTHKPDSRDPNMVQADVEFLPESDFS